MLAIMHVGCLTQPFVPPVCADTDKQVDTLLGVGYRTSSWTNAHKKGQETDEFKQVGRFR